MIKVIVAVVVLIGCGFLIIERQRVDERTNKVTLEHCVKKLEHSIVEGEGLLENSKLDEEDAFALHLSLNRARQLVFSKELSKVKDEHQDFEKLIKKVREHIKRD
jgi:hypothetical protein